MSPHSHARILAQVPRGQRILANAALLAAGAAILTLAACKARHAGTGAAVAVPVAIATFNAGSSGADVVLPARVKAAEEVSVAARISARLTSLSAREGSRVRRGDPIAVFDAPETRRALAAARAELESAELGEAVAARQEARIESLFTVHVVAQRDREVAGVERRTAEARLESARAAYDALSTGATVRAPFDGVVVRVHVDPGADVAAGAPLADLRSAAGLEVVADVPEDEVGRLAAVGLAVQIDDGPWRPARLMRLDGMTDWRSRSRTAHLAFGGDAEPGAYARLSLVAHAGDADDGSVPAASLVQRGSLDGVFVVDGGEARLRWLKLGRARGARVEVLAGLEPGENFALAPRSLVDGQRVQIQR